MRYILFACCIPSVLWLISCKKNNPSLESNLYVGVSVAPVNPPLGAFIAGDKQNRKFTSIHDSLFAKAVVLDKDDERIAILTLDCIGLLYPDVLRIRKRAKQLCGFSEERIIISSTHTHSGPDVVGIWGSDYENTGIDSAYMEFLVQTAAMQIKLADEAKQPVNAVVAETTFGDPWVQNICNEEIDRSVNILQFRNQAGNPIATLTNFACHPTFLDANFSAVSADYVHGYYNQIQKQTGGEALFLQGAIGGWVQPEDGEGTFEKAYKRGSELAEVVVKAIQNARPLNSNQILFKSKEFKFPVENDGWKQLAAIGTIKRNIKDSVTTELSWFSIGEAQFVTHPGETAPYYGIETKKLMNTEGPKFILGLGNDALGYIVKPSFFEDSTILHSGYLTSMSVGKQTAPLLMDQLKALIPNKTN